MNEAELRNANLGNCTLAQATYQQKRLTAAHKRYMSAIKTLATVRKLAIPVLIGQVNIAEKQVNQVHATK